MQKKAPKQNPPKFQNLSLGINLIFPRLWSFHSGKKRVRASEVLSLNWLLWKIPKEITLVILIFLSVLLLFLIYAYLYELWLQRTSQMLSL